MFNFNYKFPVGFCALSRMPDKLRMELEFPEVSTPMEAPVGNLTQRREGSKSLCMGFDSSKGQSQGHLASDPQL